MWKIKSAFLVFFLVGLCAASGAKSKVNNNSNNSNSKQNDLKEKRDVVTPTPYSYEIPQKAFRSPINVQHNQPKYTQVVEAQHVSPQKVAPLEYPKEDLPQTVNEPSSQYHPTTFHSQQPSYAPQQQPSYASQQSSYTPDFESLYSQSLKHFDDNFGQSYQQFDSFNHIPFVHYNGDYDKINSAIVAIPGYAVKAAPVVSNIKAVPSYVYAAPASSYNYPTYSYPTQSYVQSYPQAIAASSHQHFTHSHGFAQSPSAIFIPQAISIAPSKVPSKLPDYASSSKSLSHYSSTAPNIPSNTYVSHYSHNHPQTERPFKPSPYLGPSSSHIGDSYTEQSIVPSKTYLPSKEYSYASHGPQVEYQIQYVQQPSKTYLPAKEHHAYTPIQNTYLPAKEQQHHQYTQHVSPVSNNYLPPQKAVHVEQPKSSYLPPIAVPSKTYLPSKSETPSNVYLPSKVEKPSNVYLPSKVEKPSSSYLPPNNPYHSAPSHQYTSHEYESAEYQAVASHSGHK